VRLVENKYLIQFSNIQSFKIRYAFKNKHLIDVFGTEFERALEETHGGQLFNFPTTHINFNYSDVFSNIDFDILKTPVCKLRDVAFEFLNENKPSLVSALNLRELVNGIQENYNYVPYHSFSHSFAVMHLFHIMISKINESHQLYDKNTLFVCYIACLGHDLNHKSKNNGYHISIKSKYSLVSFNQSVLEKHHIKTLFSLLKNEKMDIFHNYNSEELAYVRKLIIENILSTDILNHKSFLAKFEQMKLDSDKESHLFFTQILTQASDIGNGASTFPNYMEWARLITQEFDFQTELEAKRGLKINEFMKYSGVRNFIDNQIGFYSGLIRHVSRSPL